MQPRDTRIRGRECGVNMGEDREQCKGIRRQYRHRELKLRVGCHAQDKIRHYVLINSTELS